METVTLISQAPLEDIERWFDRAIDAKALPDVFQDELNISKNAL
jgi:hypothetical protein